MRVVGREIGKIDGLGLLLGRKAYTDDFTRRNSLVIKVLRISNENIKSINISSAVKVQGLECILINKNIQFEKNIDESKIKLIIDEFNPILENDIAIVAAESEECAEKAKSLIKLEYESSKNKLPIEDKEKHFQFAFEYGNTHKAFNNSSVILEEVYRAKANFQGLMESNRTSTYLDQYERLVVVTATEVPFHVRRVLSRALEIPVGKIRVIKSKTGGGYGGKQELSSEYYPAIVTLKTGKSAKIIYSANEIFELVKDESQILTKVKIGASYDGQINGICLEVSGSINNLWENNKSSFMDAIGEVLNIYNIDATGYTGQGVHQNTNYTYSIKKEDLSEIVFAVESTINSLSQKLDIDPSIVREINVLKKGDKPFSFNNIEGKYTKPYEYIGDLGLISCIKKGKELIGWDEKYPRKQISKNKFRGIGMAIARQDIGVACTDSASSTIKFHEDGTFMLTLGTNDLGVGSNTVLAQICAEAIGVNIDKITVVSSDTDVVPFHSSTYSTSTLYALGCAVKKTGEKIKEEILRQASVFLDTDPCMVLFDDKGLKIKQSDKSITWREFGKGCIMAQNHIFVCESYTFEKTFMPYMTGFAEVEVDTLTGKIYIENFIGVFDIGAVINPLLTKVQAEGNIVRGIGMAITEELKKDDSGKFTYSIPTRCEFGNITTYFTKGNNFSELYGAKSTGNIGVNTVAPAVQEAVYNAVGARINSLPITPEKIVINMNSK